MELAAKERLVIWVALTILLIATIYPPIQVTASYHNSSGILSFHRVVRYEFLFTNTVTEIYYSRLLLQYLIILAITVCIIATLIFKRKGNEKQLGQQISKLTLVNKGLRGKVDTLHRESERSKRDQLQLENSLKQQCCGLASAKETLDKQIAQSSRDKELLAEQETIQERLNAHIAKLTADNEQLLYEIESDHPIEELKLSKEEESERSSIVESNFNEKLKEIAEVLKRLD